MSVAVCAEKFYYKIDAVVTDSVNAEYSIQRK